MKTEQKCFEHTELSNTPKLAETDQECYVGMITLKRVSGDFVLVKIVL